jgi:DNA recombination protein RmuC
MELILSVIIIILLIALIIVLLSRKPAAPSINIDLEPIQKQLAGNATEQFRQFDIIQQSVNRTLQENRTEISATLESRLSQSFKLVGEQLSEFQKGLGEVQNLAADARSLKIALTNSVKDYGTYGEIRLEDILSDILTASKYESQVTIDGKRVDFAVKLPGTSDKPLLLPIDSKFPLTDYTRLLQSEDKADIDDAKKSLAKSVRLFAKDMSKYISPPTTTDFALMFLPTEGLYAEVAQNIELFEELRVKHKIIPVGPTTICAFLSSLLIGFKTLAIEQRSLEVWDTLRTVKKQFSEFESVLNQAKSQLETVDKTIDKLVGVRTRAINKSLQEVELSDSDQNSAITQADDF